MFAVKQTTEKQSRIHLKFTITDFSAILLKGTFGFILVNAK